MAEELKLPSAHKPDSMEICFIPDKNYIRWLESRGTVPPEGDFIFHGQAVGLPRGHTPLYRGAETARPH